MPDPEPAVCWIDSSPRHIAMIRAENYALQAQVRELSRRLAVFTGGPSEVETGLGLESRAESIARSARP